MAFGSSTISGFSGAASDLFAAEGLRTKAKGSRIQAEQYDLAAKFARQNVQFTRTSTEIKTTQEQRKIYQTLGQQQAEVASSGFAASGSALDLMRDSAAQGALTKAVLGQQGLIEEAGYEQQAKSYELMAKASRMAADADEEAAEWAGFTAAIKGIAAVATLGMLDVGAIGTAVYDVVGGSSGRSGPRVGPFPV